MSWHEATDQTLSWNKMYKLPSCSSSRHSVHTEHLHKSNSQNSEMVSLTKLVWMSGSLTEHRRPGRLPACPEQLVFWALGGGRWLCWDGLHEGCGRCTGGQMEQRVPARLTKRGSVLTAPGRRPARGTVEASVMPHHWQMPLSRPKCLHLTVSPPTHAWVFHK